MKKPGTCITAALFIILCFITTGCQKRDSSVASIQVKGSDTEVNLVQRLAEVFMEKNPEAAIAVTGGGSGTGIAALINRLTDIANSSRAMKKEEIKKAKERGVDPVAAVFALDGLALIAHQSFPLDSLNLNVLAGVFKGDISHWKEINGPDIPVSLYGRQSNSGTFIFFRDYVLKGDYSQNMKRMNGTAQIVEAIKQDRGGIGYVGIGYVVDEQGNAIPGIRILNIAKDAGSQAVSPLDPENVKSGLYPISRPLYQYTNGVPAGRILEFIQFELSDEGQKIVAREGYYPITSEYTEANKLLGIIQ